MRTDPRLYCISWETGSLDCLARLVCRGIRGQKIANIYDYTYALDAVKIGQPVSIVVLRNGQRLTLHVRPGTRK